MDKVRTNKLTVDKLTNSEDAKRFLLGLGLHVDEGVVKQVVKILSGKADLSFYSLYATRPDKPPPVCGKGTAYKIKELYAKGELEPYLAYLSQGPDVGEAEAEQVKEAEHEQKPPEEISHEQQAERGEKLVALIQKWRQEVGSYSPVQLLQGWLDETPTVAVKRFYTNEDTKSVYLEARQHHFETLDVKRLSLEIESDPVFGLLRQKFPTCKVWAALEVWGGRAVPYLRTFYDLVWDIEEIIDLAFSEGSVDDTDLRVFTMKCMMGRAYAVLISRDLLTSGIKELPSNLCRGLLTYDLERLGIRANLELSSLTKRARKGGWPTANLIEQISTDPQDHSGLVQRTRDYPNELVKLQSAQQPMETALGELENKLAQG